MDNFDLKRFLVENKMTRNSRLVNEDLTYDALPAEVKQRYENNGRIGVAFVKKDGSVRHMSFSKTLKAYQPSATAKTDAQANYRQNNNLWSGYDVNAYIKAKRETGDDAAAAKQSFRNFKLENVLAFSAGGRVFDMRDENNIIERFGEDVSNALTKTMIQALERDSAPTAEPTADESQIDESAFDQAISGMMGGSNNSQSVKASFEGKWNPIPKANKDILDKSTGKDTQLVGVFGQSNYAIAKGSDGKFYRYQYRQASTPGTPKGPFDTVEKAKEGIK